MVAAFSPIGRVQDVGLAGRQFLPLGSRPISMIVLYYIVFNTIRVITPYLIAAAVGICDLM